MLLYGLRMNPAWTYSRLEKYETCPKQFYHHHVAKDFRDEGSVHSEWGDRVHTALEDRVKESKPLPEGMTQWESITNKLLSLPGEKLTEYSFALNTSFQPTEYNNAWTRGKADLLIVNGQEAAVFDYKTGKKKPSEQLTLYAAYTFAHYPQVNVVHTGFIWLKDKKVTPDVVKREALPVIWQGFLGRVSRLENAYKNDHWPERPSGLCNGWCPVKTCKYWKPKR